MEQIALGGAWIAIQRALHRIGAAPLVSFGAPGIVASTPLHGAGNGMITGTLPFAIFGPQGYGLRSGLLSAPARTLQAAAPFLFGLLLDAAGSAVGLSAGLYLAAFGSLFPSAIAPPPRHPRRRGANGRLSTASGWTRFVPREGGQPEIGRHRSIFAP